MSTPAAPSLFGAIAARTIGDRDSIRLRDFLAAEIPEGVRTFVRTGLLRSLGADLDAAPHLGPVLRAGGSAGRVLRHTLRVILPDVELPRSQFLALLAEAVRFHEAYVVRPRATLAAFLFPAGARSVPADELLERLDAAGEYPYLAHLLRRSLAGSAGGTVRVEEFLELVDRLDGEVVKRHSPAELARLAAPVFALHGEGGGAEPRSPVAPLLAFFGDKKMEFLARYIGEICAIRGLSEVTLPELEEIIEGLYREAPPAPAEQGASTGTHAGLPEPEAAAPSPRDDEAPTVPPQGVEPVPAPSPAEPREEVPADRTQAGTFPPPPTPPPPLARLIHEDLKKEFVRKLFHRDPQYYDSIVSALDRLRTWEEASAYLRDLYENNRLDPLSPVVIAFTDAVQQRFTGNAAAGGSEGGSR